MPITIKICGILLLYNNYIFHVVYWYNNQWVLTNHSARIIFSYCINTYITLCFQNFSVKALRWTQRLTRTEVLNPM